MSATWISEVFGEMRIRKATKVAAMCEYGRRVTGGPYCTNQIAIGDRYVEGDLGVGGFKHRRWCMECAATFGHEATAGTTK